MFYYDGMPFQFRVILFAIACALAWYMVRRRAVLLKSVDRWFATAAKSTRASIFLILLTSIGVNAAISTIQYPKPVIHDEYSYLLAADTYANGRLTNPTHPHWKHFETFHVLSQPSYMSKYPPANGLALGAAQFLTGHSIVASWLSVALALVACFWMLQAWLPGKWPLVGAMLLAINVPMIMGWGQTYWGRRHSNVWWCAVVWGRETNH